MVRVAADSARTPWSTMLMRKVAVYDWQKTLIRIFALMRGKNARRNEYWLSEWDGAELKVQMLGLTISAKYEVFRGCSTKSHSTSNLHVKSRLRLPERKVHAWCSKVRIYA